MRAATPMARRDLVNQELHVDRADKSVLAVKTGLHLRRRGRSAQNLMQRTCRSSVALPSFCLRSGKRAERKALRRHLWPRPARQSRHSFSADPIGTETAWRRQCASCREGAEGGAVHPLRGAVTASCQIIAVLRYRIGGAARLRRILHPAGVCVVSGGDLLQSDEVCPVGVGLTENGALFSERYLPVRIVGKGG